MDEDQFEELMAQLDDDRATGLRIVDHRGCLVTVNDVFYDQALGKVVIKLDEPF